LFSFCKDNLPSIIEIKKQSAKQRKYGEYFTNIAIIISASNRKTIPKKKSKEEKPKVQEKVIPSQQIPVPATIAQLIIKFWIPVEGFQVQAVEQGFINFLSESKELAKEEKQKEGKEEEHEKEQHEKEHQKKEEQKIKTAKMEVENTNFVHQLKVKMIRSKFVQEEFELYRKYQQTIHHDQPGENTEDSYTNFLVKSPIPYVEPSLQNKDVPPCGFGSFHQQYYLDDKLIAVGVVDVLPECLSSVYFFYDPAYHFLDLGVISALREIEWVQNIAKECPNLKYYYLGFYIHSCQKMKYKGKYKPSDLLCPENFQWVPLSECIPKLEKWKYSRFVDKEPLLLSQEQKEKIAEKMPLYYQQKIITISSLQPKQRKIVNSNLVEFLDLIGARLALNILYAFN